MPKFDMGAAWDDAMVLVRSHLPLTSVLAGIFFFLPSMAMALLGPVPFEPPADATPAVASSLMFRYFEQLMPWFLGTLLASTVGSIAVLRLWLARSGTSVADALVFAMTMLPTAIVLFLLQIPLYFVAMLLLIVPALYLIGRLSVIYPCLADKGIRNPITAFAASWKITEGNGWRISLFVLLVIIAVMVISVIVGSVIGLLGPQGTMGYVVGSILNSAVGAGLGLVNTAVIAATYRQLAVREANEIFA